MKKEIVIAMVFGILLGLGVAVVMITNIRKLEGGKSKLFAGAQISPTVKAPTQGHPLKIISPSDGAILSVNKITIKGEAPKSSLLVIQSPASEKVLKNANVNFSTEFPLALGENIITITVYPKNPQDRVQKKIINIYFLDEK